LVFAAISADLADAAPLKIPIERVFAQDATLQVVGAQRTDARRVAHEIGALLAHAEKYRCSECGFAGRNFYWHCPACHAWDSFEAYAIVKLG
jgi:lipopolysaccharide assembly protein B